MAVEEANLSSYKFPNLEKPVKILVSRERRVNVSPATGGAQTDQYNRYEGCVNPFSPEVDRLRKRIENALDETSLFNSDCPGRLRDSIRYSLLGGGKRLRPLLTLLACRACGAEAERALPAAVAIEMIHTYSLIHDDLPAMDDDDLRRGRPTNHIQFGEATAILAGDGLLTRAFDVLVTQVKNPELAVACCRELSEAAGASGMVGGQQADLEAETRGRPSEPIGKDSIQPTAEGVLSASQLGSAAAASVRELVHQEDSLLTDPVRAAELLALQAIHRRKTGKIITCSVRMGGILAEATPQQLDALTRYGDAVGLAFQVMDDILDCTGTVAEMGKGVGKDADRDKLTYPGLLGLAESRQVAESLVETALRALDVFHDEAADLRAIARYITERTC